MFPLTGLRELSGPARRFLYFSTINVISWQCLVGQPLILFARALDMPPAWVGVLIALLPLSMLLVVVTGPLVARLGPRRILTSGWLLRNLFAATIIAIPWAMHQWGRPGAWLVLFVATLGFCLFRAFSVGGWFPWLYEVLPAHQRGLYLASETALGQVVTIMVVVGCGTLLGSRGSLNEFYLIYGLGITAGLFSLVLMHRIPGGLKPTAQLGETEEVSLRPILRDRGYLRFVLRTVCGLAVMTGQSSIAVMYLRDILAYSDRRIMYLIAAGGVTVVLTIGSWLRRAEGKRSNIFMAETLAAHAVFSLVWLGLIPDRGWTGMLALAAVIGSTFCNAAFTTITTREMLGRIRDPGRIGYTNIWIVATSLATGLIPILAGLLVDLQGLTGFRVCFLASGMGGMLAALTFSRTTS